MSGIEPPNYTMIPNQLLGDHKSKTPGLMADMSDAELRVCLGILRCTLGWHKTGAKVSNRTLMKMTGLSSHGVQSGAEALERRGWVSRRTTDDAGDTIVTEWELVTEWYTQDDYAQGVPRSATGVAPGATPTVPRSATGVAPGAKPSEKEISKERGKERGKKEGATAPAPPAAPSRRQGSADKKPPDPTLEHPAVKAYRDEMHLTPDVHQRQEIIARVRDQAQWCKTLRDWRLNKSDPKHIGYILDRYENDMARQSRAGPNGNGWKPRVVGAGVIQVDEDDDPSVVALAKNLEWNPDRINELIAGHDPSIVRRALQKAGLDYAIAG